MKLMKKGFAIIPVIISVVLILGLSFFVYKNIKNKNTSNKLKNIEVNIKGFYEPDISVATQVLENEIDQIKNYGLNTIAISPKLNDVGHGNFEEIEGEDEKVKAAIKLAHDNNLQVLLEIAPTPSGFGPNEDNSFSFERNIKKIITKYAQIAQDSDVEFFTPLKEPLTHMNTENANKFVVDIIKTVRKYYSGAIVYSDSSLNPKNAKEINQDFVLELEFLLTGHHLSVHTNVREKDSSHYYFSIMEDRFSLNNISPAESKRIDKQHVQTDPKTWHTLKITQNGKSMIYHLDGKEIISHNATENLSGSISLNTGGVKVKNISLTDSEGNPLINPDFIGLNWVSDGGWTIEDNVLVGSQNSSDYNKDNGELILVNSRDLSGYDILAINFYNNNFDNNSSKYSETVKFNIQKALQSAEAYNIRNVIIGRFGGTNPFVSIWEKENPDKFQVKSTYSNQELQQIKNIILEEAKNTSGYIYDGWETTESIHN